MGHYRTIVAIKSEIATAEHHKHKEREHEWSRAIFTTKMIILKWKLSTASSTGGRVLEEDGGRKRHCEPRPNCISTPGKRCVADQGR